MDFQETLHTLHIDYNKEIVGILFTRAKLPQMLKFKTNAITLKFYAHAKINNLIKCIPSKYIPTGVEQIRDLTQQVP